MQAHETYRGARHRALILIYIAWLTLSLAPAMVAPPERTFQQGQPEMQQAMDNFVTRPTFLQKRGIRSVKDGGDFQEVNSKTLKLLEEAEEVLKTLPDTKDRNWIESFVEKMQEIAKLLEETARHKNQAKDRNSAKGAPVPDGLPKQPKRLAPSAVPETIPFQKPIGIVSKTQMTSPEADKALQNDDHSDRQAVTTPVPDLVSKMEETESDELVRELESLHKEKTQVPSESPNMVSGAQLITTTPSSSSSSKRNYVPLLKEESEKAKLKAKLIEEIEEFHRRGGVMPKEVIDVLYADNHEITDPALNQNINTDEEIKYTEAGIKNRQGMIGLDDVNNENREISMANMQNLPPYAAQQFQYMKFNRTFPNGHPNFMQAFPKRNGHYFQNVSPLNRAQFFQGNPQNFEKMNPYNQGKYQDLAMLHQPGNVPGALRQKMAKPYYLYNRRLPPSAYRNYYLRHNPIPIMSPYPYAHNWNPQNSSTYLPQMVPQMMPQIVPQMMPQMMPPYVANQAKVGTQLSDEMKRELRDGKIIVLSDSVVRSNFEANKENITTTGKPGSEQLDKKNETIAEN